MPTYTQITLPHHIPSVRDLQTRMLHGHVSRQPSVSPPPSSPSLPPNYSGVSNSVFIVQ